MSVISRILQLRQAINDFLPLPQLGKKECLGDLLRISNDDPGIQQVIDAGMAWLGRAQDNSRSQDGGIARHFSLVSGWSASYPETTGYIIPTLLYYLKSRQDSNEELRQRAKRMLDWLVSIQLPCGGFQGGVIDEEPAVPVTFNTGQILLGLVNGVNEFGEIYREPMRRAADWLVKTQDSDGCWRKNPSPFALKGEKTYDTHVAWALLEAARVEPTRGYEEAALANIRWALRLQKDNGWFEKCCLSDPQHPLTHTLGYALRGVLEAYRFTRDASFLEASKKTADGLLPALRQDGFLPGRLDSKWHGAAPWSCLTGTVQIAACWLMLYEYTNDVRYRDAAFRANQYVRRTVKLKGPPDIRGGIKGSFPVYGGYGTYQYLNWACKFFLDSNMLEKKIRERSVSFVYKNGAQTQ